MQVQAALQAAAEQHAAMERKRVEVTVALEHQQAALEANSALAPKVCYLSCTLFFFQACTLS